MGCRFLAPLVATCHPPSGTDQNRRFPIPDSLAGRGEVASASREIGSHSRPDLVQSRGLVEGGRLCPGRRLGQRAFHLSSKFGTCKTVTARFWPWLLGKSPYNLLSCSLFARQMMPSQATRSESVCISQNVFISYVEKINPPPKPST